MDVSNAISTCVHLVSDCVILLHNSTGREFRVKCKILINADDLCINKYIKYLEYSNTIVLFSSDYIVHTVHTCGANYIALMTYF